MSEPIDLDKARERRRPRPLTIRGLDEFEGKELPRRDWLIPSVLVRHSVTLLAGDGGTGKSLLCQQLQVAAAIGGQSWLGIDMPAEPVTSFGFYCEDDEEELHRRYYDICKYYGVSFSQIGENVRFISRIGEDNELCYYKGTAENATIHMTELFGQVREAIQIYGAQLVILDTVSDTFGGNENNRRQVKSFVNRVRRLSLLHRGGVIINSHPSKASMADGSFFSGSTAWHGSVRNRLYLSRPKKRRVFDEDDEQETEFTDERELRVMKSNYSVAGDKIKCRYDHGVFITTTGLETGGVLGRLEAKAALLEAAKYLVERGAMLVATTGTRSSLTALARDLAACKDIGFRRLLQAQDDLLADKKLELVELGPPTKRRKYVRPAGMLYPQEAAVGPLI